MQQKIYNYILDELSKKKALLFGVIDPLDYKSLDDAIKNAELVCEGGADAILLGGSIGVQGEFLDVIAKRIKEKINVPLILFPGNIGTITQYADAIYFMSMLNSRNPYWITRAQMLAAPLIKLYKIEPLSVSYLVVEPGGTVGWVGEANLIPRNKPKIAAYLALASEYLGFKFVLTDAGSNPQNGPIPLEMVKEVASSISIPYIVAGGIKTPLQAKEIISAGANIIQVGTAFESNNKIEKVKEFVRAVREGAKNSTKTFLL